VVLEQSSELLSRVARTQITEYEKCRFDDCFLWTPKYRRASERRQVLVRAYRVLRLKLMCPCSVCNVPHADGDLRQSIADRSTKQILNPRRTRCVCVRPRKTKEFQTQLLHYFSKSDNKSIIIIWHVSLTAMIKDTRKSSETVTGWNIYEAFNIFRVLR